jgi:hypothetical protein
MNANQEQDQAIDQHPLELSERLDLPLRCLGSAAREERDRVKNAPLLVRQGRTLPLFQRDQIFQRFSGSNYPGRGCHKSERMKASTASRAPAMVNSTLISEISCLVIR